MRSDHSLGQVSLLGASLLWAFSFGLIARYLTGVDAAALATVRLGLSALLFLPFLRPASIPRPLALRLFLLGSVQYGLMYVLYIQSYAYLAGHEVALLTALTPLYVVLLSPRGSKGALARPLFAAGLAIAGAGWIVLRPWGQGSLVGALYVQGANFCFALGQVLYARWAAPAGFSHRGVFALLYLGGFACALLLAWDRGGFDSLWGLEALPLIVLAYLGLVASGLGFFLWNVGASRVNGARLAVFNNIKVPLAVLASLLVFEENADIPRLVAGSLLIGGALALTLDRLPAHASSA